MDLFFPSVFVHEAAAPPRKVSSASAVPGILLIVVHRACFPMQRVFPLTGAVRKLRDHLALISRAGRLLGAAPTFQRRTKFVNSHWLGDVIVHSGGQTSLAITLHRIAGHGNDSWTALVIPAPA
jgi:hypothetical protein